MVLSWKLCWMSLRLHGVPFVLCCGITQQQLTQKATRSEELALAEGCQGHGAKGAVPLRTALPSWSCLKTHHAVKKCKYLQKDDTKRLVSRLSGMGATQVPLLPWPQLSGALGGCIPTQWPVEKLQFPMHAGARGAAEASFPSQLPTAPLLPLPLLAQEHLSPRPSSRMLHQATFSIAKQRYSWIVNQSVLLLFVVFMVSTIEKSTWNNLGGGGKYQLYVCHTQNYNGKRHLISLRETLLLVSVYISERHLGSWRGLIKKKSDETNSMK